MKYKIIFFVFPVIALALLVAFFDRCTVMSEGVKTPVFEWKKLREIDRRGLNKEKYHPYKGRVFFKVGGNDDVDSLRAEALKKIITEKVIQEDKVGRWYKEDDIESLILDVDNLYDALMRKRGAVNAYFVLFDHKDNYDKEKRVYVYEPTIYVPKERYTRFPEKVRRPLKEYLSHLHIDDLQRLHDQNEIVVVLTGIELRARKFNLSPINKNKVKEILVYAPENIRIFIEKIIFDNEEITIDNFKDAKYKMEGEMIQNLRTFVRNFLISRPMGYKYDLICIGYADRRPIKRNIRYYGAANLGLGEYDTFMFKPDEKIMKNIKNNLQLSIARAHSGAEIIFNSVKDELDGNVSSLGTDVYYSGGGIIDDNDLDAARQIRVRVIKKEF